MAKTIGIDIGGTKILGAVVDEAGRMGGPIEHWTEAAPVGVAVQKIAEELVTDEPGVAAVGLAVAGFIEAKSGRIAFAPNLVGIDPALRDHASQALGLPVVVENDANCAAWAESRFGAGVGARNLILLTVGTGVGGGVVISDALYRGSRGFAAEFGHMVIVADDGEVCSCGQRGCLEAMASGTALGRLARRQVADRPESTILTLAGGRAEKITGATVGEAANGGDEFALDLFREIGRYLGTGLAGLAHAFDPELIVIGGGVADVGEPLLRPAADELAARFEGKVAPPSVVPAKLGNDAGVIGAAALAAALTAD